jgi:adenylate cyclase
MLHQLRGDVPMTLHHARASGAIASEHGLSFWQAGGAIFEGWAMGVMDVESENGITQLQRGLHGWLATDSVTYQTYYLGLLADLLARSGRASKALRILREALALVEQTSERLFEPELYRMRGEILLHAAEPTAALMENAWNDFQKSLTLARGQHARSYALLAAMSMVRFEIRFGASRNARNELEAVYRSFQEGLSTLHLLEARRLLDIERPGRVSEDHSLLRTK